ncbi:hypothetical protein B0H13DRAFT_1879976 [Mycena leptocephala]|nr:hypothetical protein B0H13DRAFT_1879976 [Mycena leptocephala]
MGDSQKAQKRKPRAEHPSAGTRKAAGTTSKTTEKENDGKPRLKPRPLHKNPSVFASDADAAELLMGLGGAHNSMDKVFDIVMGVTPEGSVTLDLDQYGGGEGGIGDGSDWEEDKADEDQADEDLDSNEEDYTIIFDVPYCYTTFQHLL